LRRAVLWDSSAILAFIDADDADHEKAVTVAREIARERRPSFITNYGEVETHALLLRRLGRATAREWLARGGLTIVRASPQEEEHARAIIEQHDDKDYSLCDAISFAIIEARGVYAAFSFDRHFRQYSRFRVLGG
jgi:uncharacterized protein